MSLICQEGRHRSPNADLPSDCKELWRSAWVGFCAVLSVNSKIRPVSLWKLKQSFLQNPSFWRLGVLPSSLLSLQVQPWLTPLGHLLGWWDRSARSSAQSFASVVSVGLEDARLLGSSAALSGAAEKATRCSAHAPLCLSWWLFSRTLWEFLVKWGIWYLKMSYWFIGCLCLSLWEEQLVVGAVCVDCCNVWVLSADRR